MNSFIIDVETHDKKNIIRRLGALKSTSFVEDGGMYHEDRSYSQILVSTAFTEQELEDWLYKGNFDYVGVVEDRHGRVAGAQ